MTFIYYFLLCGLGFSVEVDLKRRSVYFSKNFEVLRWAFWTLLVCPYTLTKSALCGVRTTFTSRREMKPPRPTLYRCLCRGLRHCPPWLKPMWWWGLHLHKKVNMFCKEDWPSAGKSWGCLHRRNKNRIVDLSLLHRFKPPSAPVDMYDSIERTIRQIDNEVKETFILGGLNCNLLDQASLDKWHKAFVANLGGISAYAINN